MKKNIYLLIIILFFVTACQQKQVTRTHGIAYLEKREKLIIVSKSNKNDAVKVLGQPSTKGMSDDNLWIYIERTSAKGKLLKFGRSYLKKNNVLVLEFNKYGVLTKKEFFDMKKMNEVKFAKDITKNEILKENFIYSFLASIRQKMKSRQK